MPYDGEHLRQHLVEDGNAAGIFGICYSILTWSGVAKGFSVFRPRSWIKSVGKLIEDGYATTFLIAGNELTLTGMSDEGWVFDTDDLDQLDWARQTANANTHVYYLNVDDAFLDTYDELRDELEGSQTSYAVLWPNLGRTRYENCVSHCHYLMYSLGLGRWIGTKGWWVPSFSNWVDWLKSFVPTSHNGRPWRYAYFNNTNTHIP